MVAEWHGHIDHDKGAWKAVQMATFYADEEDAMVVIESNTLETEGTEGNNFEYILDEIAGHYSNLYCRTPADQIRQGAPAKWGFHTNINQAYGYLPSSKSNTGFFIHRKMRGSRRRTRHI